MSVAHKNYSLTNYKIYGTPVERLPERRANALLRYRSRYRKTKLFLQRESKTENAISHAYALYIL